MDKGGVEKRRRQPREKRGSREKSKHVITFRVTPDEKQRLLEQAGGGEVSGLIRARLLNGKVPNRDVLRLIAALHVVGRNIQVLACTPGADPDAVARVLDAAQSAIEGIARKLRLDDEVPS